MSTRHRCVLGASAGIAALAFACSSKDRPPPANNDIPASYPDAAAADSGGGDERGRDGGGPTVDGCGSYDPNRVYLRGTTSEGSDEAECWVTDLPVTKPCAALHHSAFYSPVIRPSDGKMLYIETIMSAEKAFAFVPDKLTLDNHYWRLPARPWENDDMLVTPNCTRPVRMFAWPDDPGFAYVCDDGAHNVLRNADGKILGVNGDAGVAAGAAIVALGYTGHLLRERLAAPTTEFVLFIESASGEETRFADPAINGVFEHGPSRARPDGFWVALTEKGAIVPSLWHLGFDGKATRVGTYATPPSGAMGGETGVLDGSGALFGFGRMSTGVSDDIIIKRALAPGASSIVYSEKDAPEGANDFSQEAPIVYPKIHISHLVTGP
jgi:hypothetical protein